MYAEQLCIYNVLCTKYPGNARVDCELAQLYLKAGKIELAQQTLMQIPLYIRENEKIDKNYYTKCKNCYG